MPIRVSVVVPTYKRPHLLSRCIDALLAQNFAKNEYDIIVADDSNDPQIREVTANYEGRSDNHASVHYVPVTGTHGPAAARNRGWRAARGEIIAFTDDDCVPNPDWLQQGLKAFSTEAVAAVWGTVIVPLPATPTDYERDAARLQGAGFVTANCFCRRSVLQAIGGLDEAFSAPWREDSDLYFTMLERGYSVVNAPDAKVVHPIRPAPWGTSIRQQHKVRFDALLYKKHKDLYRRLIRRSPPWRYYGILFAILLSMIASAMGQMLVGTVAASVWLYMTGRFGWERVRDNSREPGHLVEMALTSIVIPPLAIFWRLVGAMRYRVMFL